MLPAVNRHPLSNKQSRVHLLVSKADRLIKIDNNKNVHFRDN